MRIQGTKLHECFNHCGHIVIERCYPAHPDVSPSATSVAKNEVPQQDDDGEDLMEMISDVGHNVLDGSGMVPMIGEVADLDNAERYAAESEYGDDATSAAVPFIGNAANTRKFASRVTRSSDDFVDDIMVDFRTPLPSSQGFWAVAVPSAAFRTVVGAFSYQ